MKFYFYIIDDFMRKDPFKNLNKIFILKNQVLIFIK